EDVNFAKIAIIDGKLFADSDAKEVIAGKVLADDENIVVGDDLLIGNETFKVVGIFDSGNVNMDMNYFMSLDNMQNIKNDKGNISFIYVKVDQDFDAKSVEESLESKYGDNMTIVTSISDLASSKDLFDMILGVSYAVSLLAVIIGVVLIINTMLTSVFDRTREIGVLKAIGWSDKRILFMIICESIVLSITAAILGTIIGVVAAEIIALLNVIAGVSVVFTIWTILEAFVIAIIVGAIGGLYPAIKAVKLPPTEALKYE
ncbi:MAG: ABC transporter permease, partial [Methanobrevibacter sp.]|nr:ABC transporter permease [Methanobrevibacter sp.]